jgi:D-alanyl-D-alanine carboxypeptidase (penicillin-binding protein 5/6)
MSKHPTRKRRAEIVFFSLLLVAIVLLGIAIHSRLNAALPELSPHIVYEAPTAKAAVLSWPANGEAAVGTIGYGVLASHGVQKPEPTASVAKLITVLTVLKVKPITAGSEGPTLTLSQADVDIYNSYVAEGGSVAYVEVGEQITEYQMIQAMLLPSANNMADSLAIWAYGSLPAYAVAANQMVASLGLKNTHVGADASGYLPSTTSTASDLVQLGELAAANPIISDIASQPSADIPVAGTVNNVDWLLGTDGINGLKTGNSDQAGGVFLFSAPYTVSSGHVLTIIGAVMDQPTLNTAMLSAVPLLTSTQKGFGYASTVSAGQAVGQYVVPWGKTITAIASSNVAGLTWQGAALQLPSIHLRTLRAPQDINALAGNASAAGGTSNASSIVLTQAIPKPSLWWRLSH